MTAEEIAKVIGELLGEDASVRSSKIMEAAQRIHSAMSEDEARAENARRDAVAELDAICKSLGWPAVIPVVPGAALKLVNDLVAKSEAKAA